MSSTETTSEIRAEYIAGLRALADLLEANDDLGLPYTGRSQGAGFHVIPVGDDDQKQQLAAWTRALRGRKNKAESISGSAFYLHGKIRGLHLTVICDRDTVCEKVVTGVREVTEDVPDPELLAAVPVVSVTKTVEDVQWVCRPLLADVAA